VFVRVGPNKQIDVGAGSAGHRVDGPGREQFAVDDRRECHLDDGGLRHRPGSGLATISSESRRCAATSRSTETPTNPSRVAATPRRSASSAVTRRAVPGDSTWWPAPLCGMARRNSPAALDIASSVVTLIPPADSPKIVTLPASPRRRRCCPVPTPGLRSGPGALDWGDVLQEQKTVAAQPVVDRDAHHAVPGEAVPAYRGKAPDR